jgi:hypothetical protein
MRTNYVILYTGGRMPEGETDQEEVVTAWENWYSRIGNSLVDAGNPFSSRAKSITSDGRIKESSLDDCSPSGYTIIQAESLEAAVSMAKTCPILKDGAKISVYETYETYDALGM